MTENDDPPPVVCKTPVAPEGKWFTEITDDVGLGWTDTFKPVATEIVAADLDGDGLVDLIPTVWGALREDGKTRTRFVLMNKGGKFVDTLAESGLLATRDGAGGRGFSLVNLGDLNNDGFVDLIACPADMAADVKDPCVAFLNDGKGHFTMAEPSALDAKKFWVPSASLFDYDRDGILDFWPGTVSDWPYVTLPDVGPKLFRGLGDGTFEDVSKAVGLPTTNPQDPDASWRRVFGVTVCDIDGDGDMDVVLAAYGRQLNHVYRNDNGKFVEVGKELGVASDDRADFSDDQSYRCYCRSHAGQCPANVDAPAAGYPCPGRNWIPGSSDTPSNLGGNYFSFACADLNDDGKMDLVSATIRHGDVGSSSDPSEILLNDGKRFVRPGNDATGLARKYSGINWNEGDMLPAIVDIDLDGRKDIYMASSDYPGNHGWLWRQKADGTFEDVTEQSGIGQKQVQGIAFVDIDNDGDLDLIAGTSTGNTSDVKNNAIHVYRNDVGQSSNFVRVRLHGKGAGFSNASGIGARVAVTAGGRTQYQEVQGGYGHSNAQHDLWLTFGLGAACAIDEIEVRWPDQAGTVTKYRDVRANYRVEIFEGETKVKYLR